MQRLSPSTLRMHGMDRADLAACANRAAAFPKSFPRKSRGNQQR